MRVRVWTVATALAVAWMFFAPTSTAAIAQDLTSFVFAASAELDTTQINDLR